MSAFHTVVRRDLDGICGIFWKILSGHPVNFLLHATTLKLWCKSCSNNAYEYDIRRVPKCS